MSAPSTSIPKIQSPGLMIRMPSSGDAMDYKCSYCTKWNLYTERNDPIIIDGNFACVFCENGFKLQSDTVWNGKINDKFTFSNEGCFVKRSQEKWQEKKYLFSEIISKSKDSKESGSWEELGELN